MRKISLYTASLLLAAVLTITVSAQTPQTQSPKIGLINTLAFNDAKTGITKYSTALGGVDAAFKKELDDLNAMVTRIQTMEKEIAGMQKEAATPAQANNVQFRTSYNTKLEEYDKLGREYKFKQDDARTRYQRRRQEAMGPILIDIGKALQEFAKQRGFTLILDGSKLSDIGVLLGWDDKVDVTKDFITFYNARPATATVTAPVKK
ncbi:MAG TPA: OmpH family outer membrane protein [Pyrinomonadaceae bacterium]|jgi:Skp family chaperone for outer membrane proteins